MLFDVEELDVEGAMEVPRHHSDFIIEALFQNKCFNRKVTMFTFMYMQHTAAFFFTKLHVSNFSYLKCLQAHVDIQKESLEMPFFLKLFDRIFKESLTFGPIFPISLELEKLNKVITITRLQSA